MADRTGQTFTYPHTFDEASAEIDRLKGVAPQSRRERRYERKLIADQVATGLNNTAFVRDETSGYGSQATWRHNHQPDQPMISSNPPAPARNTGPKVGKRVELARYTVRRGGERILYGSASTAACASPTGPSGPSTSTTARTWSRTTWNQRPSSTRWWATT